MKRISLATHFIPVVAACFVFVAAFFGAAKEANAVMPTSFRQPHPLNWAYATPVGEMPGWTGDTWTFFELSNANVWNAPLTMTDRRTGEEYKFKADYEQLTAIFEMGMAANDWLALSLEIPYAYRGGGFLDNVIDGFHVMLGNRRFNRQFYVENKTSYTTSTGGVGFFPTDRHQLNAVSNLKPKFKFWLWKWEGTSPESCPCGLSLSAQVKVPVQDESHGGTTGNLDYSGLLHFGAPVGDNSAIWLTAAYTRLGLNPAMKNWPLLRNHMMYELSFDIDINTTWGFLMQFRAESPYLDIDRLEYVNNDPDPAVVARDRAASGWNALVHWQGAEAFGLRFRPSESSQINFLFAEDWGLGNYDASDGIYSNNAPDFNVIIQSAFSW